MAKILMLNGRMVRGYGVDVVVDALTRRLRGLGHAVMVACGQTDGSYADLGCLTVAPHRSAISWLVHDLAPDVVVFHSAPYFDLLEGLRSRHPGVRWVVWEHGDPTPELFPLEAVKRRAAKTIKALRCYPNADLIVCISRFIAQDIEYAQPSPARVVIYNGCDHVPPAASKSIAQLTASQHPLRIGTLTRLGPGEALYKGSDRFIELVSELRSLGVQAQICFMGRGSPEDAAHLKSAGFEVHLNASEEEKWQFLCGLNIFISCSRWEGFNLPLVEAQALGTLSMAFEVAAHPEVCQHVYPSVPAMALDIQCLDQDRQRLLVDSAAAFRFARTEFTWQRAAEQFDEALQNFNLPRTAHEERFAISLLGRYGLAVGRFRDELRNRIFSLLGS